MRALWAIFAAAPRVVGKIDLSAWISGVSYSLGLLVIGPARLQQTLTEEPLRLVIIAGTYAAFLMAVLCIQRRMRLALTATSFGKPAALYTSGAFHYSRNPIYVAFLFPLASLAILSPLAAFVAISFYIPTMTFSVIRKEERELAQQFGESFMRYADGTPRWLLW